jgi:hypothetical protein
MCLKEKVKPTVVVLRNLGDKLIIYALSTRSSRNLNICYFPGWRFPGSEALAKYTHPASAYKINFVSILSMQKGTVGSTSVAFPRTKASNTTPALLFGSKLMIFTPIFERVRPMG